MTVKGVGRADPFVSERGSPAGDKTRQSDCASGRPVAYSADLASHSPPAYRRGRSLQFQVLGSGKCAPVQTRKMLKRCGIPVRCLTIC
jgi:hypothetical protein